MSVLLAREEQAKRAEEKINSPLLHKLLNGDVTKVHHHHSILRVLLLK